MPIGTWIIYADETGRLQRCKLSSKSIATLIYSSNRLVLGLGKTRKRLALDLVKWQSAGDQHPAVL